MDYLIDSLIQVGIKKVLFLLASGNGSNFAALAEAVKEKKIKAKLVVLVCDQPEAFVVQRAQKARITIILVKREDFASRADFEAAIIQRLKNYKIDLIALAGFMRMLSFGFVKLYRKRIIKRLGITLILHHAPDVGQQDELLGL